MIIKTRRNRKALLVLNEVKREFDNSITEFRTADFVASIISEIKFNELGGKINGDIRMRPVYLRAIKLAERFVADLNSKFDPKINKEVNLWKLNTNIGGSVMIYSPNDFKNGSIKPHEFTKESKTNWRNNEIDYGGQFHNYYDEDNLETMVCLTEVCAIRKFISIKTNSIKQMESSMEKFRDDISKALLSIKKLEKKERAIFKVTELKDRFPIKRKELKSAESYFKFEYDRMAKTHKDVSSTQFKAHGTILKLLENLKKKEGR